MIHQPRFRGEFRHVAHLGETPHREQLRALLTTGQLLVSMDGLDVARFVSDGGDGLRVQVGDGLAYGSFATAQSSTHGLVEPRLLELQNGQATVFGTHVCGETGVFRLHGEHATLVTPADEFLGVQNTPAGVLVYVRNRDDEPDMVRLCAPFFSSHLSLHRSAQIRVLPRQTLLILEPIDLGRYGVHLHRYTVNATNGFCDLSPVPIGPEETIVGIVAWHETTLLGVRGSKGSFLKNLSWPSMRCPQGRLQMVGELEALWQSPMGKAYAWVTRIAGRHGRVLRQFGIDQRIIHTDDFAFGAADLVWSPDGTHAGLRIQKGSKPDTTQHLISTWSGIQIRPRRHVEEFCVDDHGQIVAWIETDGRFSEPRVQQEPHDGVELAWNLSLGMDGGVRYNRVLSNVIMRVVDQTHLIR